MNKKDKTKILYFDIETSPNIGYTWGTYEQNVIEFVKEWHLLSVAWKWNDGATKVVGNMDYSSDQTNDLGVTEKLWELFDEADLVIGHNIDRFDIRKANARFLYHGMTMPSDFKTVDTLKVARRTFALNSNKLNDIAKFLNLGQKATTGGFQLWLDCLDGKAGAWRTMKKYNKQDVELTHDVYMALRQYMPTHPNSNLHNETTHNCPTCQSTEIQKRGFTVTRVGKYQRYQCQSCGAWSRGEKIKGDKIVIR